MPFLYLSVIAVFLSQAFPVSADLPNAAIRIGKHSNYIRIVFTTDEDIVQKTSVMLTSDNLIKVGFPVAITMTAARGPLKNESTSELSKDVRITVKGNGCLFKVNNLDDINVSKLSSPARLIIDAHISQSDQASVQEAPPLTGNPVRSEPVKSQSGKGEKTDISDESYASFESFVIDAGHGGLDAGIRDKSFTEKEMTLTMAKEIEAFLSKKGKKVSLIRKSDLKLSLKKRIKMTNERSPDMLLSIHVSSGNEFVIYSLPKVFPKIAKDHGLKAGRKTNTDIDNNIAAAIVANIKNDLKINARHEGMSISLLSSVNMPSIMIELPNPQKIKYDKKTKDTIINSIFRGISAHTKVRPTAL